VATLTKSNLNADSYPLTAAYRGDTNNLSSTSAVLNQTVLQTTSAAALTSSVNPSTLGQAITFTAKIKSPTVIPSGPVTFKTGTTVLGTTQLSSGKAIFTTSTLPAGSTVLKVTYNGNSNIKGCSVVAQYSCFSFGPCESESRGNRQPLNLLARLIFRTRQKLDSNNFYALFCVEDIMPAGSLRRRVTRVLQSRRQSEVCRCSRCRLDHPRLR